MDEETLNNTGTISGDQHVGGFILLERVDCHRWRAYDWSAFFVRLMLSAESCKSFLGADGQAVTDLSAYSIMQLCDRLEIKEEHTEQRMVFIVPKNLLIAEPIYTRWKNNLPAEPKPEDNELQGVFRG